MTTVVHGSTNRTETVGDVPYRLGSPSHERGINPMKLSIEIDTDPDTADMLYLVSTRLRNIAESIGVDRGSMIAAAADVAITDKHIYCNLHGARLVHRGNCRCEPLYQDTGLAWGILYPTHTRCNFTSHLRADPVDCNGNHIVYDVEKIDPDPDYDVKVPA